MSRQQGLGIKILGMDALVRYGIRIAAYEPGTHLSPLITDFIDEIKDSFGEFVRERKETVPPLAPLTLIKKHAIGARFIDQPWIELEDLTTNLLTPGTISHGRFQTKVTLQLSEAQHMGRWPGTRKSLAENLELGDPANNQPPRPMLTPFFTAVADGSWAGAERKALIDGMEKSALSYLSRK